eukprot:GILK01001751.1.p1 GENE.GILK01001751.1~~GILK01001751.1.p1  ORF type:complete len:604 (+),score=131.81 GILK01001751.1:65-1813(+)
MTDLLRMMPAPKGASKTAFSGDAYVFERQQPIAPQTTAIAVAGPPRYGFRQGWVPRRQEDFADGGAFPEIHVAQFPLEMGRKKQQVGRTVALQVDGEGNVEWDAVVKQGRKDGVVVYSKASDLRAKHFSEEELAKPDVEMEEATTMKTKAALEKIMTGKAAASQPVANVKSEPTYVKYTPNQKGGAFNSGATERVIRLVEAPSDPLEPAKHRHKKLPGGPPEPPVPVLRSPPRKLTAQDQQDWKIPPAISNWKNAKGYVIPLDKRLAADGRGLQDASVNDKFSKLAEALYNAERAAREEVEHRAQLAKKLRMKQEETKEQELRDLAAKARAERSGLMTAPSLESRDGGRPASPSEEDARKDREQLRRERKRELERDFRMEQAGKKAKSARDVDRDISERIALGQAQPTSVENMVDQRLYNQNVGMDTGFGEDDSYNIYEKPLFADRTAASIYRPTRDSAVHAEDEEDDTSKMVRESTRPSRGFEGADKSKGGGRSKPVEFEKEPEDETVDPFGLDQFFTEAKKGRKAMDKIGSGGLMSAAAGGSREMGSGGDRGKMSFTKESSSSGSSRDRDRDRDSRDRRR